jgi:hypothetical protein
MSEELEAVFNILWTQDPEGLQHLANIAASDRLVLTPAQYDLLKGETIMDQYFSILGFMVKDAVTGFVGVCDSVSFDLYGCVQCIVRPIMNDKGELLEAKWFDWHRLLKMSEKPVMKVPNFSMKKSERDVTGPAEKSVR